MLDIHKIETELMHSFCRAMKVFDDCGDFAVGQQRIILRQPQFAIQNWMMIENAGYGFVVATRTTVASGMRQLQSDQEPVVRPRRATMLFDQDFSQSHQTV